MRVIAFVLFFVVLVGAVSALSDVNLTEPSANTTVNASITLNATTDAAAINVTFSWLDGGAVRANITILNDTVNDTSFATTFNTSELGNGRYTLQANATNGSLVVSDEIEVVVRNSEGDRCGNLTSSYTLLGNVSAEGTCFTISADDVVLDCAGSTITYASSETGNGVRVASGVVNMTIRSCSIIQATAAGDASDQREALMFAGEAGAPVEGARISDLTISTLGNYSVGVSIAHALDLSAEDLDVSTNGSFAIGLDVSDTNDSSFEAVNVSVVGDSANAVDFETTARVNASIFDLSVSGDSADAFGVYDSVDLRIDDLSADTSGSPSHALGIYTGSESVRVANASLATSGDSSFAVYIYESSDTNVSETSLATNGSSSSVAYVYASENSRFTDVTFSANASGEYELVMDLVNESHEVFVVSSDLDEDAVVWYFRGTLHIGSYADVTVTDTAGTAVGANISYIDAQTQAALNPTDSGSQMVNGSARLILYGSSKNSSLVRVSHSNYTLNATRNGVERSASFNASQDGTITFSFPAPTRPSTESDGGGSSGGALVFTDPSAPVYEQSRTWLHIDAKTSVRFVPDSSVVREVRFSLLRSVRGASMRVDEPSPLPSGVPGSLIEAFEIVAPRVEQQLDTAVIVFSALPESDERVALMHHDGTRWIEADVSFVGSEYRAEVDTFGTFAIVRTPIEEEAEPVERTPIEQAPDERDGNETEPVVEQEPDDFDADSENRFVVAVLYALALAVLIAAFELAARASHRS